MLETVGPQIVSGAITAVAEATKHRAGGYLRYPIRRGGRHWLRALNVAGGPAVTGQWPKLGGCYRGRQNPKG